MTIQPPNELRDRINDLCRQHKWDQAECEIEARDAAISAEERERCDGLIAAAQWAHPVVRDYLMWLTKIRGIREGAVRTVEHYVDKLGEAVRPFPWKRDRAQPVPAPGHGDLLSRSGAKAEGAAERAKETGDE